MRRVALAAVLLALPGAAACSSTKAESRAVRAGGDWSRFGYDAARSNSGPATTGLTSANLRNLVRQRVRLDGTVDSSPVYLRSVRVRGARRDVFFVTTSYGKTIAVDADRGTVLWRFTPRGYGSWVRTDRITNSTPVADPGRRYLYAAAPDGRIHKLSVATGSELGSRGWPVAITRDPTHEKIGPALNFARGLVLAATGGYVGDAPPYQGHVVAIEARSGRIVQVWNALCSDRRGLLVPRTCSQSGAAIWARSGVVVAPRTGNLLLATGDGRFNGRNHWGDSVLMLSPNAGRLLRNWTPRNHVQLEEGDIDLGSTAPAVLSSRLALQGGKDGKLRLLSLGRLGGRLGRTGGALQTISAPDGSGVFSAPAVQRSRGRVRVFVGTDSAIWCYVLRRGRLAVAWRRSEGATSPVVAGGLLYAYDPAGGLNVYRPATGQVVARLHAGTGHWNSPIVTDGRIALPEGDANRHSASGVLDIWRLR